MVLVAHIIVDVPLMQTDRPYSYLVPEAMHPDEKDAPDTPRGLGVVYLLESTVTGERIAVRTTRVQ